MEQLAASAFRSVGSIFTPGMLGVFVKSVLLTVFALILFVTGVTSLAGMISGYVNDPAMAEWLPYLSGFGAMLFAYFLFPGIMPVIVNFFDNRIATLIERRDYPAARPMEPPFWPEFWHDVRFSLMAIALNILVLPLYLIPVVNLVVFYVLNGHLLGKEFFIMVARRHQPLENAKAMRAAHGRIIFIAGALLAILATVPVINLFAPFWGIAMMTHLYHALARTPHMEILNP